MNSHMLPQVYFVCEGRELWVAMRHGDVATEMAATCNALDEASEAVGDEHSAVGLMEPLLLHILAHLFLNVGVSHGGPL